ncbi:hypothetical protein DNI29_20985 [Hymenobacter sediminis]|uniref:PAS domain-containing sensor histidine kinase n=1 Tax=Hymenobacter sediminis TaxID=2218621 RepID=UPI000DA64B1F|nr:ATP-binding protein [Hymenobacter sediminis]RPD44609.1 hypothetical protein DNI29_20985 [Hymenobacter sediminis]
MLDLGAFLLEQAHTSPHIQFIYDLQHGQVVFINAAYEWVLGGQKEQVNNELPALLNRVHPDDRGYLAACWERWGQDQLHEEVSFRLQLPDKPEQWLQLTPSYYPDKTGPGWVGGVVRDVSVAKHYKAHADRFNARKNTILEILSVDLSDTLVLSQGLRWEAADEVNGYIQARLVEGLKQIESRTQEGTRLVREFVDEEIEASAAVVLNLERVELGERLRRTVQDYPRAEALAAHTLKLELPSYPIYVAIDVNKFLQVVTNLLSNALKFTPDGGHLTIQLVVLRGAVAHLTFSDNGIGIPEELQPYIFERFTRARRPGLRGEPTLGVGLSLCKMLVELHQGTLSMRSREGEGTTFLITLPVLPG